MCPTIIGRIHTRVAITCLGPGLLGLVLSLVTSNASWIVLIGIYLLLGITLDVFVYWWAIRYQPPWMTFILALAEFGLLYVIAREVELDLTPIQAVWFYWASWLLAIATKVALLPLLSLTYLESSGEFRRTEWSIPPQREMLPIIAAPERGEGVEAE